MRNYFRLSQAGIYAKTYTSNCIKTTEPLSWTEPEKGMEKKSEAAEQQKPRSNEIMASTKKFICKSEKACLFVTQLRLFFLSTTQFVCQCYGLEVYGCVIVLWQKSVQKITPHTTHQPQKNTYFVYATHNFFRFLNKRRPMWWNT